MSLRGAAAAATVSREDLGGPGLDLTGRLMRHGVVMDGLVIVYD